VVSGFWFNQRPPSETRNHKLETDGFMKRREFIILSSVGAASASLLSACGHAEEKLIPALIPDEEYVPGIDYWKASTCGMCPAGCGIIVRTREHKANKIEGNPLHPVNRGALCARGQAGLQVLYNPDRIKGPMKRVGQRGEGKWEEISWDEAIKTLAEHLRAAQTSGPSGLTASVDTKSVAFVSGDSHGVTQLAAEWLSGVVKSMVIVSADVSEATASYESIYGKPGIPIFDLANSSYLLSFGARFLENWHSPVMYSQAYGEFRHKANRGRGRFVQVEPRMSLTGANADEWLPAAEVDLVALAIMQVMIREGLAKNPSWPDFVYDPMDWHAPERTADQMGVPSDTVIRIAREFAGSERPLAIGGSESADLRTINHLNVMIGNVNKPGGVLLGETANPDPLATVRSRERKDVSVTFFARNWGLYDWERARNSLEVLLLHQVNPAYTHPRIVDELKEVPFIASFASVMDETTELADLILPDHCYLERWDIRAVSLGGKRAAVSVNQPIVKPELNTIQTAEVLIALAEAMGGAVSVNSAKDFVKQAAEALHKAGGSLAADTADDFFTALSDRGVWSGELPSDQSRFTKPDLPTRRYGIDEEVDADHPMRLLLYEHSGLGYGEEANLPCLQELPDTMTSVMWGSWVEMNPKTATEMGIADGELVEVSTELGSVRAPAVLYPAIRPDVIAMPYGQGHTGYGRYAANRGANPAVLRLDDQRTLRAKVTKVEGKANLIRFGTDLWQELEKKR
jgi:anaerobic selenocysteine-containing dehydrogenase